VAAVSVSTSRKRAGDKKKTTVRAVVVVLVNTADSKAEYIHNEVAFESIFFSYAFFSQSTTTGHAGAQNPAFGGLGVAKND
jgi:hypothetical protein